MADRKPLKLLPDGGGDSTGLGEFVAGDTLGVVDGGTGLAAVGANQLLTGNNSSTTGALTSESNLTFDGSTLNVVGNAGVGIARTDGTLHVHTATAGSVAPNANEDDLVVENSGNCGITILAPDANDSTLCFGSTSDAVGAVLRWNHDANLLKLSTANAGDSILFGTAADVEAMRITSAGNVSIADGDLVISTAGHGIDFSATSNGGDGVSELLDDYEEGTFTAVWKFGTTVNTKASDSAAWYTKVGGLVTVWFKGAISGAPSGTGNLSISGLPFTSESTSNHIATTGVWANRITNIGDGVTSEMYPNTTLVSIQKIASSTSSDISYVQHSDCVINTQVRFNISYRAA